MSFISDGVELFAFLKVNIILFKNFASKNIKNAASIYPTPAL